MRQDTQVLSPQAPYLFLSGPSRHLPLMNILRDDGAGRNVMTEITSISTRLRKAISVGSLIFILCSYVYIFSLFVYEVIDAITNGGFNFRVLVGLLETLALALSTFMLPSTIVILWYLLKWRSRTRLIQESWTFLLLALLTACWASVWLFFVCNM
jgi:hypothetical protein